MRIIAGEYKGCSIKSLDGNSTRPTTDYFREVIFSTLFDVENLSVLDLYSGSGALALEAISRGASHATLVDGSESAVKTILSNVEKLKCRDKVLVQKIKSETFVKKTDRKFDLILIDPPYSKNCVNPILELIFENDLLNPDGTIVVEHSNIEPIEDRFKKYISKEKKRGITVISFLEPDSLEEKDENI
jgi:16S rRNA (guanine966-N2)-methyltransferase